MIQNGMWRRREVMSQFQGRPPERERERERETQSGGVYQRRRGESATQIITAAEAIFSIEKVYRGLLL